MSEPAVKMEFRISAQRLDAHGGLAQYKESSITLDTGLAGRRDAFSPADDPDRTRPVRSRLRPASSSH